MVLEVMGRHAGWIAMYAGIAGGADVILIPEIPSSHDAVCARIVERERAGRRFSIVVVAEGARERGGGPNALDRALCSMFGARAVELIAWDARGQMVTWHGSQVGSVAQTARALGISPGD